jgi:hypothetical protein
MKTALIPNKPVKLTTKCTSEEFLEWMKTGLMPKKPVNLTNVMVMMSSRYGNNL